MYGSKRQHLLAFILVNIFIGRWDGCNSQSYNNPNNYAQGQQMQPMPSNFGPALNGNFRAQQPPQFQPLPPFQLPNGQQGFPYPYFPLGQQNMYFPPAYNPPPLFAPPPNGSNVPPVQPPPPNSEMLQPQQPSYPKQSLPLPVSSVPLNPPNAPMPMRVNYGPGPGIYYGPPPPPQDTPSFPPNPYFYPYMWRNLGTVVSTVSSSVTSSDPVLEPENQTGTLYEIIPPSPQPAPPAMPQVQVIYPQPPPQPQPPVQTPHLVLPQPPAPPPQLISAEQPDYKYQPGLLGRSKSTSNSNQEEQARSSSLPDKSSGVEEEGKIIQMKMLPPVSTLSRNCYYHGFRAIEGDDERYLLCLPTDDNSFHAIVANCPVGLKFSRTFRRCVTESSVEKEKEILERQKEDMERRRVAYATRYYVTEVPPEEPEVITEYPTHTPDTVTGEYVTVVPVTEYPVTSPTAPEPIEQVTQYPGPPVEFTTYPEQEPEMPLYEPVVILPPSSTEYYTEELLDPTQTPDDQPLKYRTEPETETPLEYVTPTYTELPTVYPGEIPTEVPVYEPTQFVTEYPGLEPIPVPTIYSEVPVYQTTDLLPTSSSPAGAPYTPTEYYERSVLVTEYPTQPPQPEYTTEIHVEPPTVYSIQIPTEEPAMNEPIQLITEYPETAIPPTEPYAPTLSPELYPSTVPPEPYLPPETYTPTVSPDYYPPTEYYYATEPVAASTVYPIEPPKTPATNPIENGTPSSTEYYTPTITENVQYQPESPTKSPPSTEAYVELPTISPPEPQTEMPVNEPTEPVTQYFAPSPTSTSPPEIYSTTDSYVLVPPPYSEPPVSTAHPTLQPELPATEPYKLITEHPGMTEPPLYVSPSTEYSARSGPTSPEIPLPTETYHPISTTPYSEPVEVTTIYSTQSAEMPFFYLTKAPIGYPTVYPVNEPIEISTEYPEPKVTLPTMYESSPISTYNPTSLPELHPPTEPYAPERTVTTIYPIAENMAANEPVTEYQPEVTEPPPYVSTSTEYSAPSPTSPPGMYSPTGSEPYVSVSTPYSEPAAGPLPTAYPSLTPEMPFTETVEYVTSPETEYYTVPQPTEAVKYGTESPTSKYIIETSEPTSETPPNKPVDIVTEYYPPEIPVKEQYVIVTANPEVTLPPSTYLPSTTEYHQPIPTQSTEPVLVPTVYPTQALEIPVTEPTTPPESFEYRSTTQTPAVTPDPYEQLSMSTTTYPPSEVTPSPKNPPQSPTVVVPIYPTSESESTTPYPNPTGPPTTHIPYTSNPTDHLYDQSTSTIPTTTQYFIET